MPEPRIIRNAVQCLECGTVLESTSVHDFVSCSCPNRTFVDGGLAYLRRGGMRLDRINEMSTHAAD